MQIAHPNLTANYDVRFTDDESSTEAMVFFHGFPADIAGKNEDYARAVSLEMPVTSYVMHYQGLGKSEGRFSFLTAIQDAKRWVERILETYQPTTVHVFGHSFGGLVALNVAKELAEQNKLGALFLLSPLNSLESHERIDQFAPKLLKDNSQFIEPSDHDSAIKELHYIFDHHNPRSLSPNLPVRPGQVCIWQAREDEKVPRETTDDFVKTFALPPVYHVIDENHRFNANRQEMIKRVVLALRRYRQSTVPSQGNGATD